MTVNLIGSPSPERFFKALARIMSQQTGEEIELVRITNKETGEIVWERKVPGGGATPRPPLDVTQKGGI